MLAAAPEQGRERRRGIDLVLRGGDAVDHGRSTVGHRRHRIGAAQDVKSHRGVEGQEEPTLCPRQSRKGKHMVRAHPPAKPGIGLAWYTVPPITMTSVVVVDETGRSGSLPEALKLMSRSVSATHASTVAKFTWP